MIYIDDNDPEEVLEPYFCSRDVTIKYNTNARELYDTIEEIGRGKFGTVYKCKEKATGLKLAAKFIPIPKREDRRNVEREVEIMNSLQHHLIIQLYAAYEFEKMMYVVQELIEGGELFDRVIDEEFVLTEKVCTVFVRQICEAMQFIHSKYILHLDLKPENILCLTKEGNRIKIIDFGLARKFDPDKKLQILFGTPEFVAPEVVNFDCISYGTDMWSVGVICYVLLSGLSPFMGESDLGTMANVTVAKYDFDDEAFNDVSPEALDFISKLLIKDLDERMTATEALEHKWLKRPLKPPLSPKPCIIPPIKFKTLPLMPFEDNTKDDLNEKELEQTKDNLRTFIERWEEHPNSPYMFDTESNLIVPIKDTKADSINSSRACSPSPCESISSITEEQTLQEDLTNPTLTPSSTGSFNFQSQSSYIENLNETENLTPSIYMTAETDNSCANKFNPDFNKYLQSFERRNSDTNYLLGRRSSGEKVNLANEIKKLSEHLMMLAEINNKLIHDTNNSSKEQINEEEPEIPSEINESQIMTSKNKNTQKDFKKPTFKGFDKIPTLSNTNSISKNTNNNLSQISFTFSKPSTVTSTVTNQSLNKSTNSSNNLSLTKKNIVTTTLPTLKLKENDYSVTAKIKINSTNEISDIIKNEHKSPESWNNNERRLSDTQNAALTISKFVQISQGKEKVSQLSSAQKYEQSQQYQKQKQNNNFVSNKKVNTLSERLHQSIDNVPKIAEFARDYDQTNKLNHQQPIGFSNKLSTLNEFTQINSKIQNRAEIPSVTFKINKASSLQSKQTLSAATKKLNVYKDSNNSLNKNTETDTASQRRMSSSIASIYQKFSDNNNTNNNSEVINDLNSLNQTHFRIGVPWAMHTKKRTKFRISETSRDVPISSPNTHQEYNLEEAATQTKDCLLHLLEKYNDTIVKTGSGSGGHNGRHQSISVDRGFSQNLEYQSMSSINTFFQRHAISGGNVKNIQAQLESKNDCTSK